VSGKSLVPGLDEMETKRIRRELIVGKESRREKK
jgi:hypothetical protein